VAPLPEKIRRTTFAAPQETDRWRQPEERVCQQPFDYVPQNHALKNVATLLQVTSIWSLLIRGNNGRVTSLAATASVALRKRAPSPLNRV
jgi:hypothetical protein